MPGLFTRGPVVHAAAEFQRIDEGDEFCGEG